MCPRAEENKDITLTSTRGTKLLKTIFSINLNKIKNHTPSEALAIFVEVDFTRKYYTLQTKVCILAIH